MLPEEAPYMHKLSPASLQNLSMMGQLPKRGTLTHQFDLLGQPSGLHQEFQALQGSQLAARG